MMNDLNFSIEEQENSDKVQSLTGRGARARFAILKALDELGESAGAAKIAEMLGGTGIELQARSIRFHLQKMDQEGLTHSVTKHEGRLITDIGRKELARRNVMDKVGFVASKMDELGYRMTLDAESGKGTVVANVAIINKKDLSRSLHHLKPVFASGFSMGDRIAVRVAGGRIGKLEVPRGKIMLSTICSVTIAGLFIKAGIPVISRLGGLVEMDKGVPKRFIELTEYQGTSVDPHKIFIMANMTRVTQCVQSGCGAVGVSFREFPSVAVEKAKTLIASLTRLNLNGVLAIGQPNRPLLNIPVGEGRTGMIAIDGLNPIAALHEAGIPFELTPLSGLEELSTFVPFKDVAPMGQRSTYVD
jgi:HTH-type transcriptional regulator, global nitrogen regulator NrpRI